MIALRGALTVTLAALPTAAVTVRVQPTPGGPQIHVDGRPVAPRVFFGSVVGGTCSAEPQWREAAFEFTPAAEVAGGGTLHFRFGQSAGQIDLADVRIVDPEGRDVLPPGSFASPERFAEVWNVWPPGERNTVGSVEVTEGALRIVLKDPPDGAWPDFHLYSDANLRFQAGRPYRVSFRCRALPARRLRPAVYHIVHGSWNAIGGPPGPFLAQVAMARDAGVDLVSFGAPNGWAPPDREPDWQALDQLCRDIIAVNPNALLLPRVGADAPDWWLEQHPEARMQYEGGRAGHKASVSSRPYTADAAAHLQRLCRHLAETFPDHFAGIHPCGQNTGEWFYEDSWEYPLSGYDEATLTAWRQWLADRGFPDAADAQVPSPEERHGHPYGFLRDPARERRLIEFERFRQHEMAQHVAALAAACRKATAGEKLVIFFYGYAFEFGALANGAPVSGHYDLPPLLASGDIDILCSPVSYFDRQWLGTGPCMSPAESIRDAGILWLNEDDTRTYLALEKAYGAVDTLDQTRRVLLRNTAQAALRGFGTWWMDLPGEGWFADPAIWEELVRLGPVDAAMLRRSRPFQPDIAAVLGEDSMCHLTGGSNVVTRPLIYESRAALGRVGAPYGQYLLDDVIDGRVPAKLQVLLAAWALTPEQRARLAANRAPGTSRVWCYAPGYLYPDRADAAGVGQVTGFAARPIDLPTAQVTPTAAGRAAGLAEPWGPAVAIRPLFAVDPAGAEVWATWADGSAAVAVRRSERGLDVFVGVPQLTSALLRACARLAGVHLYTESDAAVWAAERYVSVCAVADGPLTVDLGVAGAVTDALTGEPLGEGPRVTLPLAAGDVVVLQRPTGEQP